MGPVTRVEPGAGGGTCLVWRKLTGGRTDRTGATIDGVLIAGAIRDFAEPVDSNEELSDEELTAGSKLSPLYSFSVPAAYEMFMFGYKNVKRN